MAGVAISKAVAGIQTILAHFQTVAAGVANRVSYRLPQKTKIVRVGASYRASTGTDCQVMVEADGVNVLTGAIDMFPLAIPAAPVAAENQVAGAVELGSHSYKVTFVDAVGESQGSAKSNVITLAAPTAPAAVLAGAGAGNVENGNHSWKVTFVNAGGESVASAKSNVLAVVDKGADGQVTVTIPAGPAGTTSRKVYRTVAGDAGDYLLAGTVADNVTLTFTDNVADGALGAAAPAATGSRMTVTIQAGPTGTVSRKLYRTVTGDGGNHKLVGTIADNTTLTFADNVADGALGANIPTSDTRSAGSFFEGTLDDAVAASIAKEADLTVDVDTLAGTSVSDLCVQIDLVRLD